MSGTHALSITRSGRPSCRPSPASGGCQTIEINGPVEIGGVRVEPGDLVVADETSVCFVPRARMTDVLTLAQEKAQAEDVRCKAIDDGIAVPDISKATHGEKG